MSYEVVNAFISYYDTVNAANRVYTSSVPTYHTNKNELQKEEGSKSGPYIETYVVEQDYTETADTIKTTSNNTTAPVMFEQGQIIFQIFVADTFGNKDSYIQARIMDNLKRIFSMLYLTTSDGSNIRFLDCQPRQAIVIDRKLKNRGRGQLQQWRRQDLLINYVLSGSY